MAVFLSSEVLDVLWIYRFSGWRGPAEVGLLGADDGVDGERSEKTHVLNGSITSYFQTPDTSSNTIMRCPGFRAVASETIGGRLVDGLNWRPGYYRMVEILDSSGSRERGGRAKYCEIVDSEKIAQRSG